METKVRAAKRKGKSMEELETKYFGKKGTPKRATYETQIQLDLIGELIKQTREENHLTQSQLAKKLGMDTTYVSKMENNVKTQRLDTVIKVFKALKGQLFIRVGTGEEMKMIELI
jgi:HTH-type transcriptional regulator/antitoxin HipB